MPTWCALGEADLEGPTDARFDMEYFEEDFRGRPKIPYLVGCAGDGIGSSESQRRNDERDMTSLLAWKGDLSSDGNMRLRIYPGRSYGTFSVGSLRIFCTVVP